jgi:hypothetical protein
MADLNEQRAKMIANLPNTTGKTLGEWVTLIAASGLDKNGAIMKLLKGEHGVTHGYANLITHEFGRDSCGWGRIWGCLALVFGRNQAA